jgi:type I restriction enzyme, S subunit
MRNVPPGYKQTEVGVIPEEWEVRSIGQMFSLVNGCAFKPSDWKQSGAPIIRIQNLNDPFASFNYSDAPVADKNRIEAGDLLFAWSGTIGSSFGARVWSGPSGVLNQHIFKVHMDQQKITLPFSLLVFARVEEDIAKQAHGFKASFVHVKKSDLVKVSLPLPPLPEQRAIATALSDVDALIASLDRLITKKRDMKQAAMQELLTGKRRLPGFSGEWEVKALAEVVDFLDGRRRPVKDSDRIKMQGIYPYYGASGIVDYVNDFIFDDDLILLGEDGENILSRSCKLAFRVSGKIWVNNHAHVLKPKTGNDIGYLVEYLESLDYTQFNSGTAQPKLNKQTCSNISVCCPPLPEQTAIAAILSDMDTEIAALEKKRDKTRMLKQGMMQELLTGRIRLV